MFRHINIPSSFFYTCMQTAVIETSCVKQSDCLELFRHNAMIPSKKKKNPIDIKILEFGLCELKAD